MYDSSMIKESSEARFKRLASKRTNAVLEKIRVLGNCANRGIYSYSENDVNKMFGVIEKELKETNAKFQPKRSKSFSLWIWKHA